MAEYTIDKFTYGGNTYKLQDNESGYLTAADVPEGSSASTATPSYIAATPSKGTDNGFARGDHVHGISVTTGDSNGQVKVAGINASVKGLGSAAYTASTAYLPSSTVIPTQTSQLQNNSGFLTSAVTSLNSKTGAVTITAGNNVTVSATSNTITISATDTDTKNTAGATTTSSTIYLIGATATTTNPQTYATNDLLYDDGLYSYAHYFDDNNHYAYRTALDQGGRVISLYNNDVQNNTYNTVSVSPTSINITANNPSSSVVIESPNNGTYIHNVVTPTVDADAVNKEYIDKRMNFSDTDDQMWVNWYGEETAIYGQQTQSVTYSFAIHMNDNKTELTSATLAKSYNGTDWDILGTLHPTTEYTNAEIDELDLEGESAAGVGGISLMPIGTILDFAGSVAPNGYLLCDGSAVSRTDYAVLFAVIGTTWGSGDGSTTFNVPDLRGRTSIGAGTGTATDATAHILGSKSGTETHTLDINQMPAHNHKPSTTTAGQDFCYMAFKPESSVAGSFNLQAHSSGANRYTYASTNTANLTYYSSTANTGNGQAHNNMQPFAVVTKIIRAI